MIQIFFFKSHFQSRTTGTTPSAEVVQDFDGKLFNGLFH